MTLHRFPRWAALALALGVAVGCASTPKTPEEEVRARATARWQALIDGKPERAYGYLAPTVRANLTQKEYINRHGATLATAARVRSVQCEAAECTVRIALDAKSPVPGMVGSTITTMLDESWVRQDGEWWAAAVGR